jgi:serine/threonine-protein kinase RsbW
VKAVTYIIKHNIKALSSTIDSVIDEIKYEHFMDDQMLFEIKVVLNELIVNAICHGNNCDANKVTYVTIKLINNDYLYISVKDEGYGFNQKINEKCSDNYIELVNKCMCEHGRGLFIVDKLCDKVKFNKCGNRVSIIKHIQ